MAQNVVVSSVNKVLLQQAQNKNLPVREREEKREENANELLISGLAMAQVVEPVDH